jgi:hypothetical protein
MAGAWSSAHKEEEASAGSRGTPTVLYLYIHISVFGQRPLCKQRLHAIVQAEHVGRTIPIGRGLTIYRLSPSILLWSFY